ncbi:MAG: AMP-binding protein [Chloroflexi bacterium]|nr:AMP-binding protein [Chloroflexota bacterium]
MLTPQTRSQFRTLLDALTLTAADDRQDAIIYMQTDQPDIHVTRSMFRTAVFQTAHALTQLGIQPGDLVIIAHTQNLESIYLFWGALPPAPSLPCSPPSLKNSTPLSTWPTWPNWCASPTSAPSSPPTNLSPQLAPQVTCPVYGSKQLTGNSDQFAINQTSPPIIPDKVALLQHSSGTTGLQKGVALSHTAVLNQIAAYSDALQLTSGDIIVSWLPLYHDMGLIAGFLLPLIQGIPLVLMSPFDWVSHPALLLKAIDKYQGNALLAAQLRLQPLRPPHPPSRQSRTLLASMHAFINCSEPVRHDSHQLFLEKFAANGVTPEMLAVSYAMAENTFAVTQTAVGQTGPGRCDRPAGFRTHWLCECCG